MTQNKKKLEVLARIAFDSVKTASEEGLIEKKIDRGSEWASELSRKLGEFMPSRAQEAAVAVGSPVEVGAEGYSLPVLTEKLKQTKHQLQSVKTSFELLQVASADLEQQTNKKDQEIELLKKEIQTLKASTQEPTCPENEDEKTKEDDLCQKYTETINDLEQYQKLLTQEIETSEQGKDVLEQGCAETIGDLEALNNEYYQKLSEQDGKIKQLEEQLANKEKEVEDLKGAQSPEAVSQNNFNEDLSLPNISSRLDSFKRWTGIDEGEDSDEWDFVTVAALVYCVACLRTDDMHEEFMKVVWLVQSYMHNLLYQHSVVV